MIEINVRRSQIGRLAGIAAIVLLLGTAYYWLVRPQDSADFLGLLPVSPLALDPSFFARWLGWLPTFVHVFAFSLLTWLALGRRHLLFACTLWAVVNALFELGQALPSGLIQHLPDLLNLRAYLTHGVFDPLDLVASGLGAWLVWTVFRRSRGILQDKEDQSETDRANISMCSRILKSGGSYEKVQYRLGEKPSEPQ